MCEIARLAFREFIFDSVYFSLLIDKMLVLMFMQFTSEVRETNQKVKFKIYTVYSLKARKQLFYTMFFRTFWFLRVFTGNILVKTKMVVKNA